MRLAIYQPDIPQNTGTLLRLAACVGVGVDLIGPAGFDASNRAMRRAGLDYLQHVELRRHESWEAYNAWRVANGSRLVLATARGATPYFDFAFAGTDTLLLGRESAGVPEHIHALADARLRIPMRPGMRSINVAVTAAAILGEALRQTHGFPE